MSEDAARWRIAENDKERECKGSWCEIEVVETALVTVHDLIDIYTDILQSRLIRGPQATEDAISMKTIDRLRQIQLIQSNLTGRWREAPIVTSF